MSAIDSNKTLTEHTRMTHEELRVSLDNFAKSWMALHSNDLIASYPHMWVAANEGIIVGAAYDQDALLSYLEEKGYIPARTAVHFVEP